MLTFASLYPKINLNEFFYEDETCRIGVNGHHYYLISKLDSTIIVYVKSNPQKIMTFIDLILVDKLRCSPMERLYQSLGDIDGHGKSQLPAAVIRFLLENPTVKIDREPSLEQVHHYEIERLKRSYKHDCCTHFNSNISWQIKHFMKYVNLYSIRILNYNSIHQSDKKLAIVDEVNDLIYKAIIRDELLYFTNLVKAKPLKESFVGKYFELSEHSHYESATDQVIDIFQSNLFSVESHYNPITKEYLICSIRYEVVDDSVTTIISEQTIAGDVYDVNFIFNFIFETTFIHQPRQEFIGMLQDLAILEYGETLTLEHVNIYEMSVI